MGLVNATKVDTNRYEIEVNVSKEDFEKAVESVFRKNVKKISIPGFRKGKAPRHIIEKYYGEGVFYEEAVNSSYPRHYGDAVREAGVIPVDQADIEVKEVSKDGYSFVATVTTKPEVEVGAYKGVEAVKEVRTATDEDVQAEIEKLRQRNGRLVDVEDRPAKDGDNVVIDFEGFVDEKAFEGGKAEKFSLKLGSGQLIPGFEDQVCGHSVGEEFDVNVSFPDNYHVAELAGKPATFKVKLHEIKETELPELDNEFVKDISEFDTLDDFKADLKSKLQESYDNAARNSLENKLIDVVIEDLKGEIPEVMYENRIDNMVRDFEYRLQSQGMNLELYLQYTGMGDLASFRKTFREQAERQVKIRLALEKIVKLEGLTATEEELATEYGKLAEQYKTDLENIKKAIPADDLTEDIAVGKAIDLIKDSAKVTEVPAQAQE